MAIVSIPLVVSCKTTDVMQERVIMPELVFPDFPILSSATDNGDTVTIPKAYFFALAEYKIRIEQTRADYNALREIYNTQENE